VGKFSDNLAFSLLGALVALPAGSLLGGLALGGWSYATGTGTFGPGQGFGLGAGVSLVAILMGIVPVLIYGVPAYALAATYYRPSLVVALAIGVLPGLTLAALSSGWGEPFLWFGIPVAACLHFIAGPRIARVGVAIP
jgi:hypothetical protein